MNSGKDLSSKIVSLMVDTALTGRSPTVVYFGIAELSMLEVLKELGVVAATQNCTTAHGLRIIRTVESSHLEVY